MFYVTLTHIRRNFDIEVLHFSFRAQSRAEAFSIINALEVGARLSSPNAELRLDEITSRPRRGVEYKEIL